LSKDIVISGAREHNLKNVSIRLPRNKLIVFTGLSGSGKSSLAIDTIYAEGQRRYVESLSSYARQFLGLAEKPDVDYIEGLSPTICIDQKTTSKNPRSTVGTITEIYDYLRVFYARLGTPYCPNCGLEISARSPQQIIDEVKAVQEGTRFMILAPVVRGRKGEYRELFKRLQKEGYGRVKVDGKIYGLDEEIKINRDVRHDIDVVIDRIVMKEGIERRIADSVETALKLADGLVAIEKVDEEGNTAERIILSTHFSCLECGFSYGEISPRLFSFNNPYGACPSCSGLGVKMVVDESLVVPDPNLSIDEGAIDPIERSQADFYPKMIKAVAEHYHIPTDVPWKDLERWQQEIILYGADEPVYVEYMSITGRKKAYYARWFGVINNLERRYREAESDSSREKVEIYMRPKLCDECGGARLNKFALSVKVKGLNIAELTSMNVLKILDWFENLKLNEREEKIGERLIKEIKERLKFLIDVGLDYLTLDRNATTLSGGEAQRIRLATQIGSGLTGVIYVLDEPSIGLHQRDNRKLIDTLLKLRDMDNTLIVVEHDEETIRSADWIVDMGPGAGEHGGEVVVAGSLDTVLTHPDSLTARYLRGELAIPVPEKRRSPTGKSIVIRGAKEHNLKNITVEFPLGLFICVTGVSGSGKSTLVSDILTRALKKHIYRSFEEPGRYDSIEGIEYVDKVIEIDQSPIGRTPRSNPATYVKVFDDIRKVFAQTEEARVRGYKAGRFSFNVPGGRCENCKGDGQIKIEMHFLPDVYVTCDVCKGRRYNRETLEVKLKGKNIADVLEMSVEEALNFFEAFPTIKRRLQTLYDVGLGYIKLGQPATTLSGGEAQRVKLAAELSKVATGSTVYILDEPTTGLHFDDVKKLLNVLQRLVDLGNTVIVIEHNLDVIKTADWIIDLGPEGGDKGGEVVFAGSPEEILKCERSYTGIYLKKHLEKTAVSV
jgi:excinuclease ABC subunit A